MQRLGGVLYLARLCKIKTAEFKQKFSQCRFEICLFLLAKISTEKKKIDTEKTSNYFNTEEVNHYLTSNTAFSITYSELTSQIVFTTKAYFLKEDQRQCLVILAGLP